MDILSPEEELRYNRQIILRQFDFEGQEALKQSKMLVLGAGGLGCAASQYLAAAGVGELTLVDDDHVELSNLQRQVLHSDATLGELKVDSAAKSLSALNPHLAVNTISTRLDDAALSELVKVHSLVLDCSDNIDTRNQLNRLCHAHKIPLISGAAIRLEGQVVVFTHGENEPCYQCLSAMFGEQALSCVEAGILSPVVGIIGATQALEAIKVVSKFAPAPAGKLMMFDAMDSQWRNFTLLKNANCSVCNA
ncbi:molybdopterin-synthase adenylyltransferase MoeB [Enterovibrio nigricans]|uniref:Molybdopterin-synthase adenylyltransferase n=1 Tax=Enterovibrio nigricans DSM 22720 TaxID=1121868 RepID=A0A1T4VLR9_9GAMM|nr:molybdopterin-synthase adenylyltransferase MoeB [Enterovibrio nigricans]PKF49665.1 molybdopterin-synthase adenylyltransferase MoeB [Enterovibrio nigricans]SKA65521.1 adenylyltransferase and sulfurtransferase [Enterovibrio nigricans DSM 22720]